MIKLIIGKKKHTVDEAAGDSKDLVSINMDFLKKQKPQEPSENPRDYYQKLNSMAADGVDERFPKDILDYIEQLPGHFFPNEGKKYFIKWLANQIKQMGKQPSEEDVRKIKDVFIGKGAKELPDSFEDALKASDEWHAELATTVGKTVGDYKTNDVVHDFGNGYKMVRIAHSSGDKADVEYDLKLEGGKMGNCIGTLHCPTILTSEETVFSLRDSKNEPHVSINQYNSNYEPNLYDFYDDEEAYENVLSKAGKIDEIKGKSNKPPEPKYLDMVIPWIMNNFEVSAYINAESGLIPKSKYFSENGKDIINGSQDSATQQELKENKIFGRMLRLANIATI